MTNPEPVAAAVIVAVAVALVPLLLVAVMVQVPVVDGAVKKPEVAPMVPQEVAQVADADAVNCTVAFTVKETLAGVMVKPAEVTVTWAVALVPLPFVAVTVQEPVVEGAVYSPDVLIEPQEAAHVAAADAVNCCVPPTFTVALVGEIVKAAEVMVAVVEAFWPPLVAVAVMVQEPVVAGAVKSPEVLMDPHDAAQLAAALAENCTVPPVFTLGFRGEMEKVEDAVAVSEPHTV
jgi:hypothetical protein